MKRGPLNNKVREFVGLDRPAKSSQMNIKELIFNFKYIYLNIFY